MDAGGPRVRGPNDLGTVSDRRCPARPEPALVAGESGVGGPARTGLSLMSWS
jgi:hypothetical protein